MSYSTLVIDPPWSYDDRLGKRSRGAANHYRTMSLDDLFALRPQDVAARDAHLYLWVTNAFIGEGCELMRAWGFKQKTVLTWVKARPTPDVGVEHWKPVAQFPAYEVSDRGRVRKGRRMLAAHPGGGGYMRVRVFDGGAMWEERIHKLVAETWIGPCPDGHVVDHWDGDRANNDLWNLEYVTHQINSERAADLGRMGRPATGTSRTAVWRHRQQLGMGRYYRNTTEHVLFGVRGRLGTSLRNMPTAFHAPRGQHSEKPALFYEIVESMSPGPRLDVFARQARDGWTVVGNEVDGRNAAEALAELGRVA